MSDKRRIKTVYFFLNGNTAVFDENGEQVAELQVSWAELYARFLESKGYDPTQPEIDFAGTGATKFFRTEEGFNWG